MTNPKTLLDLIEEIKKVYKSSNVIADLPPTLRTRINTIFDMVLETQIKYACQQTILAVIPDMPQDEDSLHIRTGWHQCREAMKEKANKWLGKKKKLKCTCKHK